MYSCNKKNSQYWYIQKCHHSLPKPNSKFQSWTTITYLHLFLLLLICKLDFIFCVRVFPLLCFPFICICLFPCVPVWCPDRLPLFPSSSAGPSYGCRGLRWSGGGPAAVCDSGVVRGSACISPQMPPSPWRHHRFFVCSHCRLPPWQLQAPQTR